MRRVASKTITASAIVTDKAASFCGMQVGMDETNDPTITVYDGTSSAGREVLPTNKYDASALGLNGFMGTYAKACQDGIYVLITLGAGNVEVTIDYEEWGIS